MSTDQCFSYRKKPVVIEAFPWHPDGLPTVAPTWFFDACTSRVCIPEFDGSVSIRTLEGVMRASPGDWIIRGIKGEIYPCKPDIFEATYEQA